MRYHKRIATSDTNEADEPALRAAPRAPALSVYNVATALKMRSTHPNMGSAVAKNPSAKIGSVSPKKSRPLEGTEHEAMTGTDGLAQNPPTLGGAR